MSIMQCLPGLFPGHLSYVVCSWWEYSLGTSIPVFTQSSVCDVPCPVLRSHEGNRWQQLSAVSGRTCVATPCPSSNLSLTCVCVHLYSCLTIKSDANTAFNTIISKTVWPVTAKGQSSEFRYLNRSPVSLCLGTTWSVDPQGPKHIAARNAFFVSGCLRNFLIVWIVFAIFFIHEFFM